MGGGRRGRDGEGEVAREEGEEGGLNGMRLRAATRRRDHRRTKKRRATGARPARGEKGARSEVRRSVAVGDARRGAGSPRSRRSRERATDGAGSRDDDPRRAGRGGGGREEGARRAERGRLAREPAASAFPETGRADATRRSIGGAARDEAARPRGRFASRSSALGMYLAGRPVARPSPTRGACVPPNAARSERRPTDDQGDARAKGRFKRSIISVCSDGRRRPENILRTRAVPNLENVSSFFHTNTVNTETSSSSLLVSAFLPAVYWL